MPSLHLPLTPSATLAINARALEKKAQGVRVYNLSAGEPMLPPHPAVVAGAELAMRMGKTLYSPTAGIPELRHAMSDWMNIHYGTEYQAENVIVTCGGKFGIFALCQLLLQPRDEALVVAPYWVSYPEMITLFGGVPRIVSTDPARNWKVTVTDLEKQLSPRTKLLFINNAGNPTGTLYTRSELTDILTFAAQHDLFVISDEVYSGLVYDDHQFTSLGSFPEHRARVAIIQSCSKHFAMTGWRVGFVLADTPVIQALTTLQGHSTTGTASVSQWAAVAALHHADEIVTSVRSAMQTRRDTLLDAIRTQFSYTPMTPAAALYLFLPLTVFGAATNSVDFCFRALDQGNVAMVPGSAFGQEGYVRLAFGAEPTELQAAITVLKNHILA